VRGNLRQPCSNCAPPVRSSPNAADTATVSSNNGTLHHEGTAIFTRILPDPDHAEIGGLSCRASAHKVKVTPAMAISMTGHWNP
jgi:hypothetical protein